MSAVVGGIVRQGSHGESVLIQILGVAYQVEDKITAPHVMCQVAEELAAEWVIPEILKDTFLRMSTRVLVSTRRRWKPGIA